MNEAVLPGVCALEVHRSLTSTNDRAREWVLEGVRPPAVVVAEEQTAGRGRGGSAWVSGAGDGLWMSVVVEARDTDADPLLPLRVGLSLAGRLEDLLGPSPGLDIGLKWPNDLVVSGGKAGGILCEGVQDRIVVGVGLNCRAPRVDVGYAAAGLLGLEPADLVPVVAAAVLEARAVETPRLDDAEVAEWRRRDVLIDHEVIVQGGRRGTARGIDRRGRLLVAEAEGGTRAVSAGSVRRVGPFQTESR